MWLSNMALPGEDWRIVLVGFAAISVPAVAGMFTRRWQGVVPVPARWLACSLAFFLLSNAAVWAFSGMYPPNWQGLTQCYIAALPFLDKTVLGDLFWTVVSVWRRMAGAAHAVTVAARALAKLPLYPVPLCLGVSLPRRRRFRLRKTQAHRYHSATTDLVSSSAIGPSSTISPARVRRRSCSLK